MQIIRILKDILFVVSCDKDVTTFFVFLMKNEVSVFECVASSTRNETRNPAINRYNFAMKNRYVGATVDALSDSGT